MKNLKCIAFLDKKRCIIILMHHQFYYFAFEKKKTRALNPNHSSFLLELDLLKNEEG
ncbi:MAG: hypothetical protein ACTSVI_05525 [Promethearchaeota archaeon]